MTKINFRLIRADSWVPYEIALAGFSDKELLTILLRNAARCFDKLGKKVYLILLKPYTIELLNIHTVAFPSDYPH
jgi:hypothetical protein